jgi:hypothetical protein
MPQQLEPVSPKKKKIGIMTTENWTFQKLHMNNK